MPKAIRNAEQGERTRIAIVQSAVELFGKFGYRSTSLKQIAERAGVVQSVVHHHFGSKEQVLDTALKLHYPTSASRPDIEAVALGRTEFVDEVLKSAYRNLKDRELVRFFSVMTGESLTEGHPAHPFFVARYDVVRAGFTEAIVTAKNISGRQSYDKISLLVSVMFAASDGLQMQWLRNPSVDFIGGVEAVAAMVQKQISDL
jgi:AcrR family transcriptional regulator